MRFAWIVLAMVLGGCATQTSAPVKENAADMGQADPGQKHADIVELSNGHRAPAQVTPEQRYNAYRWVIVDSTKIRIEAMRAGNIAKVCNASGSERGWDTMTYYLAFETFKVETDPVTIRLRNEMGPFAFMSFRSMHEQRLPNKLHEACISGGSRIGANRKAVEAAIRAIESVYNQE